MNKFVILFFVLIISSCSSNKKTTSSEIDTPQSITEKYGSDLISSKELAASLAELIWTHRYRNHDIEPYKPFHVELINNGKVWKVTGYNPDKRNVIKRTYHMEINKNTGEILRNWIER